MILIQIVIEFKYWGFLNYETIKPKFHIFPFKFTKKNTEY